MRNDLHQAQAAAADFESALKREPGNGEAHLGLAYASLDLHKPQVALRQAELAEHALGDSRDIHVIRATAYGRQNMLTEAVSEYRAALKFTPDDGALHLGLGNALFAERQYHDAIDELAIALKNSPDNAYAYALLARSYANLQDRDHALQNVQLAEQHVQLSPTATNSSKADQSDIYISTGEALSALGDHAAAMERLKPLPWRCRCRFGLPSNCLLQLAIVGHVALPVAHFAMHDRDLADSHKNVRARRRHKRYRGNL